MRISDWSSDVCSSDLIPEAFQVPTGQALLEDVADIDLLLELLVRQGEKIALHDPGAEQRSTVGGGEQMQPDGHRPCALAEDRHLFGIAAKVADIAPHPGKRELLVHEPVVSGKLVGSQETEQPQPLLAAAQNDVPD